MLIFMPTAHIVIFLQSRGKKIVFFKSVHGDTGIIEVQYHDAVLLLLSSVSYFCS